MADQLTSDLESLRIDREPPRASTSSGVGSGIVRAVVWLAILGGLAAGGVWAWPRIEARVFKTDVQSAEIIAVSPVQAATSVTATGYVVARTLANIAPRVPGRVAHVYVHEGDHVTAGQPLFDLDASDVRAGIALARARVAAFQSRVDVARAQLRETRQQVERQQQLVAHGAAPRSEAEDLAARAQSLDASIHAAEAEMRAQQAEVAAQQVNLSLLTFTAPFAGTVMNRPPEPGNVLGPGQPSLEIADFNSIVVEVDVPEARLHLVHIGDPCEISLDAFPEHRYRGAVREIGSRVDRARATLPVRVRFTEPATGVLPDMSARVNFLHQDATDAQLHGTESIQVPASAIAVRRGGQIVFVIEDGVVHSRPVRLGERAGEAYVLLEGPPVGSRVVVHPPGTLADGSPVKETSH